MTLRTDVALPTVKVLGSTMAHREAGDREAPVALFLLSITDGCFGRPSLRKFMAAALTFSISHPMAV
jgi:hypothetical protein